MSQIDSCGFANCSCSKRVMHVVYSSHCVDFEVLVGSNGSSALDWSPVSERRFRIVEPLVSQVSHVVCIQCSNSWSNFTSVNSTTELKDLLADFTVDVTVVFLTHYLVVQMITSTVNFNIIHVVRVNCWDTNATIVHLAGKDFISEEVVSPKTSIRIGEVVTLSFSNINKISNQRVQCVVLLTDIIDVFSVFINSVASENMLEYQECVIVWVLDWRCIIEDTNVWVIHFIVTDHKQWRCIDCFISVCTWNWGRFYDALEGFLYLINKLIMRNGSSTNYNDVVTEVVSWAVGMKYIWCQELNSVSISTNWLAKLVVSERIIMAVFDCCSFVFVVVCIMLLNQFLFGKFNFCWIKCCWWEGFSKNANSLTNITFKNLEAKRMVFTFCRSSKSCSYAFDFFIKLSLCIAWASTSKHFAEQIWGTCCIVAVLSWSWSDMDFHSNKF